MTPYLVVKSLHIISFISWMAAMFYLPRLYVYHTMAKKGGELDKTLMIMERKLLKIIMNPAMIATIVFGLGLVYIQGLANLTGWFHAKLLLVLFMLGLHGYLAYTRKLFLNHKTTRSEKFYRILNELPVLLMIGIVFLAVLKPF